MKLSEKLIKLRKENGLSQEEFGNQINVSRQAISKWENEEATPDVKKIKEIVQKFDVNYDYLLNDEIETNTILENSLQKNPTKKSRKKLILKIILLFFFLYFLICIYKFITFYSFYKIANSFSEQNYMMSFDLQQNDSRTFITYKVGHKKILYQYSFEETNSLKNEEGNRMPYGIEFTDFDKKICYQLTYDTSKKAYIYHNRKEDMICEEEIAELFKDDNLIKNTTLETIPSNLKEIFFASVDPRYYHVSLFNRSYKVVLPADDAKMKVQLNGDGLLESIYTNLEYDPQTIVTSYSYDYVQDHFQEITDPIESGIYKILE